MLHSGGWKRLEQQSVTREVFINAAASVFGCSVDRIIGTHALSHIYGQGFRNNAIPGYADVEQIAKDDLEPSLKNATHDSTKGEYHKGKHAWKLLQMIHPNKVRTASRQCDRLFDTLSAKLQN